MVWSGQGVWSGLECLSLIIWYSSLTFSSCLRCHAELWTTLYEYERLPTLPECEVMNTRWTLSSDPHKRSVCTLQLGAVNKYFALYKTECFRSGEIGGHLYPSTGAHCGPFQSFPCRKGSSEYQSAIWWQSQTFLVQVFYIICPVLEDELLNVFLLWSVSGTDTFFSVSPKVQSSCWESWISSKGSRVLHRLWKREYLLAERMMRNLDVAQHLLSWASLEKGADWWMLWIV